MENKKLLEKLEDLKNNYKVELLEKLIESVKQEIVCEDFKGLSSKQRINKCLNYSKKIAKTFREVLAYTCNDQIEGYQCFCDTYFLAVLTEEDKLPIKDYKTINDKWTYPSLEWFKNSINKYNRKTFTYNVGKLLNNLKANKFLMLENEKTEFKSAICYDTLNNFVTFMNIKPNENITIIACNNTQISALAVKKANGSYGYIMPVTAKKEYKTLMEE